MLLVFGVDAECADMLDELPEGMERSVHALLNAMAVGGLSYVSLRFVFSRLKLTSDAWDDCWLIDLALFRYGSSFEL